MLLMAAIGVLATGPAFARAEPVSGGSEAAAAPRVSSAKELSAAQSKALSRELTKGERLLAKKRWPAARSAYEAALAISPGSAHGRFGLASALAGLGHSKEAVAELTALAHGGASDAPIWLVEARLGKAFAELRVDDAFRKAVGIDPDPSRPRSAYERLVGTGGHWEQTGAPCESPSVALSFDRRKMTFALKIAFRCQGSNAVTPLDGTWQAAGTDQLTLLLPDRQGGADPIACKLTREGADDLLACDIEDIELRLKVVRR